DWLRVIEVPIPVCCGDLDTGINRPPRLHRGGPRAYRGRSRGPATMGLTCSTRRDVPDLGTAPAASPSRPREGHRETVEAIAVAFILAFLVRGFVAEAFVIPTGSMAPTLMGRHKEITCPQCGYLYAVNASEEVEGSSADRAPTHRVAWGTCGNCRYQTRVKDEPSFKGDRILVMKFPYDLPSLPGALGP